MGASKAVSQPSVLPGLVSSLLNRIRMQDAVAQSDLLHLLAQEFQSHSASKRYFPLSKMRESCRQLLKDAAIDDAGRLAFYSVFADAALSAMTSSSIPETAWVGKVLQDIASDVDRSEPGQGLLLRLHFIAGLGWDDIAHLPGARATIGDIATAMQVLTSTLHVRGCTEQVMQAQNLRPRGEVTRLLENVRDGQRSLGDVVANEQIKLRRQAARLLQMERSISMQPADLVNELYLRMPRDPNSAPINRMEFEALSRRIMRHILIDRARKPIPGQSRFSEELSDNLFASPQSMEDRLLLQKLMSVVGEVLEDLRRTDAETAEMLSAALFHGADQKRLAKLHSVSVSTVKRRLKDARRQIRKRLGLD